MSMLLLFFLADLTPVRANKLVRTELVAEAILDLWLKNLSYSCPGDLPPEKSEGPWGHVWALVWQYLGPMLEPEFSLIWEKKQEKASFVAGLLGFFLT